MREELICLNGIINNDLQNLTDMVIQEINERKMNDDTIVGALEQESTDRQTSVDVLTAELAGNVTVLQSNITEVAEAVGEVILSPIGSIVAWVTKPTKDDSQEVLQLPEGWIECDGRAIPEPSIWAGSHTPDLNGKKQFLRGGTAGDQLTEEEDSFQDHTHQDNGHTHSPDVEVKPMVTPHPSTIIDKYCDITHQLGDNADDRSFYHCPEPLKESTQTIIPDIDVDVDVDVSLSSEYSNIGSADSSYRFGSETSPKNMNVIWIMRVW